MQRVILAQPVILETQVRPVIQEIREQRAILEQPVILETQAQPVIREIREQRAILEQPVILVIRALLVGLVPQVSLDLLDLQEEQDSLVLPVLLDLPDLQDLQVEQASLDLLVSLGPLDLQALQEHLVLLASQVKREIRALVY